MTQRRHLETAPAHHRLSRRRRARKSLTPRVTKGCDIYIKIDGPPPVDEKECRYVANDSSTPYVVEYDGEDAGKMAHYMLRWRMSDGTTLAFGETVSSTITG